MEVAIPGSPARTQAAQDRHMAELLDSISDGFMAFDAHWRVTYCNSSALAHYGLRREEAVGRVAWDLPELGGDGEMRAFLERAMTSQAEVEVEAASELRRGVWFHLRAFPLEDGLGVTFRDITERRERVRREREQAARLAESEARFRDMADSAPLPIWVTGAEGRLEFANRAFRDLAGLPLEELTGDAWLALLHRDDRDRIGTTRERARGTREPASWEARFRIRGEWRWLRTVSSARFDEAGAFRGYVGLAQDITDERQAAERQRLLVNELNHRVKNTLATIQSLARQTLREGVSMADARERLTERLLALSTAHNVLTRQNWESAEIADIVREAVQPFDGPEGPRIHIEGPRARVAPQVALALSMALHELATNAQKYGALSARQGRVDLLWALSPTGEALDLEWRETGGPPVSAPATKGFGSRLLSSLTAELGAPAAIDYARSGLSCRLRAPVA